MRIGIIGLGVVGGAVYKLFKDELPTTVGYDLVNSPNIWEDLLTCDVLFSCLPSETNAEGIQDLRALESTLELLVADGFEGVFTIKSTVLPGTTLRLQEKYPTLKLCHNPEFLTAARPYEDFCEQASILVGGKHAKAVVAAYEATDFFAYNIYETHEDPTCTELAKYMHNVLLSVKVGWCNEFYGLCQRIGVDYEPVRQMAVSCGVIGNSHTKVPGPDGKLGYGGACFPKDTLALNAFMEKLSIKHGILNAACEQNAVRNHEYLTGGKL